MRLTPHVSRIIAIGMLGGAFAWSQYEMRAVPAADISLESLPKAIAQWTCIAEQNRGAYGAEVKTIDRVYQAPGGEKAQATFQATYTRLGALRDWSLARTTGGWTIATESKKELSLPQGGGLVQVRLQELTKENAVEVGITWYTSAQGQAASLAKAELSAWGDRLRGRKMPWLSLYVTVPQTAKLSREDATQKAIELASILAPALRTIASNAPVR